MFAKERLWLVVVAGQCWAVGLCSSHAEGSAPAKKEVVLWLRHAEGLAQSAEVEFTHTCQVTTPEAAALLREFFRSRGNESDAKGFIYTERTVAKQNCFKRWWRKGTKEAEEDYADAASGRLRGVTASDGGVIRTLAYGEDGSRGVIEPWQGSGFARADRMTPWTLIYQFGPYWYSDIVEKSPTFSAEEWRDGDLRGTRVTVRREAHVFDLIFDAEHRVVRREVNEVTNGESQPYYRCDLAKYEAATQTSGEVIWFPHLAEYEYYAGRLADGRKVPYVRKTIEIKKAVFNTEIRDDRFEFTFPANAKVYDKVQGLGWTTPNDPVMSRERSVQRSALWWFIAVNSVLLGTVAIVVLLRKWRKVSGGRSTG